MKIKRIFKFQVNLLTSVPEFDMVQYLPEIMDGLFHILGDPNPEIRKAFVFVSCFV